MSRQMRIEYPGAVYHVTARGNRKMNIFSDDHDRKIYLGVLNDTVQKFALICHGYCLMDNHYHLLLETPKANLSESMHRLNSVYSNMFNRRHDRVGHLFQGRYRGIVVQRENYLLELCRYIVLNPVRAGIVRHPSEYEWSSYRSTASFRLLPEPFLTTQWVLAQFDQDQRTARRRYADFVNERMNSASPMDSLKGNLVLGDDDFIRSLESEINLNRGDTGIPSEQRFLSCEPLPSLFSDRQSLSKENRNKLIFSAYKVHGHRKKQIAEYLNLHVMTVGRIIREQQNV